MSDNEGDSDTPLKQVVQLCSKLAEKGLRFSISVRIKNSFEFTLKSESPKPHQGKKRSPSYVRRQERRQLLRKKTESFPEEPMESRQTNNDCSLNLSPHPDSGLFGNREGSEEEESSSAELNDSVSEASSDASREPGSETKQQENLVTPTGNHWEVVTPRGGPHYIRRRRSGEQRVSIANSYNRHIVTEVRNPDGMYHMYPCYVDHCVFAPADVAHADVARAVLSKDSTKLKTINSGRLIYGEKEFSSDGSFHLSGNEICPKKEIRD